MRLERRDEYVATDGLSRSLGLNPSDILLGAAVGADLSFPLMVIVAGDENAQAGIGSAVALSERQQIARMERDSDREAGRFVQRRGSGIAFGDQQ